ncbi:MAG: alpha/beta hydrolase [Thermoflexales bacterium]|nr:alpha/beta hydrolase [Thermoflexales bacterium]
MDARAILVLHGGPGAPGSADGLAAALRPALGLGYHVEAPAQRGSGPERLTVARHIADLAERIAAGPDPRPTLVGHSWGAMLALAFAAAHPERVGALVLVGCGTFTQAARAELGARIGARITHEIESRLAALEACADADARLAGMAAVMDALYERDPAPTPEPAGRVDARAYEETWADMLRLQSEGVYPAAFAAIRAPALMVYGCEDPHPGPRVFADLVRVMPHLEYAEWADAGHTPWHARRPGTDVIARISGWIHAANNPSQT